MQYFSGNKSTREMKQRIKLAKAALSKNNYDNNINHNSNYD